MARRYNIPRDTILEIVRRLIEILERGES